MLCFSNACTSNVLQSSTPSPNEVSASSYSGMRLNKFCFSKTSSIVLWIHMHFIGTPPGFLAPESVKGNQGTQGVLFKTLKEWSVILHTSHFYIFRFQDGQAFHRVVQILVHVRLLKTLSYGQHPLERKPFPLLSHWPEINKAIFSIHTMFK